MGSLYLLEMHYEYCLKFSIIMCREKLMNQSSLKITAIWLPITDKIKSKFLGMSEKSLHDLFLLILSTSLSFIPFLTVQGSMDQRRQAHFGFKCQSCLLPAV